MVPIVAGALAVLSGAVAAFTPLVALALVLVVVLAIAVAVRPVVGAYVLAIGSPLTIGLERGAYVPGARPHEALLLLVAAALGARWLWDARGRPLELRPTPVHVALIALAVTGSIIPLVWLKVRGLQPSGDDLAYSLVIWKYLVLFLVVRFAVRTLKQVERMLALWLFGAALIGIIALLQVTGVPGVESFLAEHYAPLGDESATQIQRGTSTLGSSLAVGDVMAVSLAIALTALLRGSTQRLLYSGACLLFALGGIASGQFSGIIATIVAVVVVGLITQAFGRVLFTALPVAVVGAFALWPVIERRLAGFSTPAGVPLSWQGRLDNLQTFFWPKVFSGVNWVLGVQPAGRIPAPANDAPGINREFVFIESGHTLLLWTGGLPFFLAYFVFLFIVLRETLAIARSHFDSIGIAAAATAAAVWIIFVLAFLDMHLTLRGMGDLFFTLLALSLTMWRRAEPQPSPESAERTGEDGDRAADLERVNLAAPVVDGSQILVPRRGGPTGTPSALVDLNGAGPDELEMLPGVGPARAAAIIEFREANGPFVTVEDLIDVPGIGEAKLAALVDLVTV